MIKYKKTIVYLFSLGFIGLGIIAFWISTFEMPDLKSFSERTISQGAKIYDRTGEILLFDLNKNTKRTVIPFEEISPYIKKATLAIEDTDFYQHGGIKITAIIRAILTNLMGGTGGGSTITQQVIKNSLLTSEKAISRKIKEWFLAIRLEKIMSKDEIFSIYLNENSYGGSIYGVEEASQSFFNKKASAVSIAEAAYLAAIPNAPTFYSPYGNNKDKLDNRKNLILQKMLDNKLITETEYSQAKKEMVVFQAKQNNSIKAPHFVDFIRQYLEEKYGEKAIREDGLKIITTLDYKLQTKAEEIVKKYALENKINFNAENAALVAIDPKTGQILVMVGSRDYFDKEIDGNFNVILAHRQPGSTFKPFVYATAFNKGYTPETVLFDLPTEFQTTCDPQGKPIGNTNPDDCYMPVNYDDKYLGPITLREALAQSRNVPSIKTLYLAGINDSINTAKNMGITSIGEANQYGLTLVLGGGEVSPLELTSAYGVFANVGIRNSYISILKIKNSNGEILEETSYHPEQVLDKESANKISDILSDNVARIPAYGVSSPLSFTDRPVAAKTGTPYDLKPVFRGVWQGYDFFTIDKISGKLATDLTPEETKKEIYFPNVHEILYWVDKNDPWGEVPSNPANDPQFDHWEYPVQEWLKKQSLSEPTQPNSNDDVHTKAKSPKISILNPNELSSYYRDQKITIQTEIQSFYPLAKLDFYINNTYLGSSNYSPFLFSFTPSKISSIRQTNTLKIIATDSVYNRSEVEVNFNVI